MHAVNRELWARFSPRSASELRAQVFAFHRATDNGTHVLE
jgi:hypothetical protein